MTSSGVEVPKNRTDKVLLFHSQSNLQTHKKTKTTKMPQTRRAVKMLREKNRSLPYSTMSSRNKLMTDTERSKSMSSIRRYYCHDVGDSLTAVHLMCKRNTSVEAVHYLVCRRPSLVSDTSSRRGDTPLHYAVNSRDVALVQDLLTQCPEAAMVRSSSKGFFGNQVSPLHQAVAGDTPFEIIDALVTASPKSLRLRNGEGKTSYQIAVEDYHGPCRNQVLASLKV